MFALLGIDNCSRIDEVPEICLALENQETSPFHGGKNLGRTDDGLNLGTDDPAPSAEHTALSHLQEEAFDFLLEYYGHDYDEAVGQLVEKPKHGFKPEHEGKGIESQNGNYTLYYRENLVLKKYLVNLVDYDMLYGHRNDIDGYAKAVTYFDEKLPEIMGKLGDNDVLMITADHGCDPGYTATTDHTREYVPVLYYSKNIYNKTLSWRFCKLFHHRKFRLTYKTSKLYL